jgi:hypothetical protein
MGSVRGIGIYAELDVVRTNGSGYGDVWGIRVAGAR